MDRRILLVIVVEDALLHGLGEAVDEEAGLLLARGAADGQRVEGNLQRAFGAGEDQAFAFLAAIDEVHAQAEVESFGIVKQAEHDIVGVAAIFQRSAGRRSPWRASARYCR